MSETLLDKFAGLARDIAQEKGSLCLFALVLRLDSPGKWDLLASAPWLEKDERSGLAYIAKQLSSRLTKQELLSLSRIVVVPRTGPVFNAFVKTFVYPLATGGHLTLANVNLSGIEIKIAHIFVAEDLSSCTSHR